ncbi:MAG: (2Fe-2S) ferredoxin domain-containing protein [Euryarchaeota archaeon]|jgi:(2Fe-2S) ferredoxin|nr:(2Fe-2S) ferredoxin domain-containing protein [Euryarchaeota archaeon]
MPEGDIGYSRHVFVCGHQRPEGAAKSNCFDRGSLNYMKTLKSAAIKAGLADVRVQKSGCLDYCAQGTTCVVYPEGVWYTINDENDILPILEHLKTGKIAEKQLLKLD